MKTPQEQAKLAAVRLTWLAVTTGLALIALAIFWFKTQNAKEVTEVTPAEPTATAPPGVAVFAYHQAQRPHGQKGFASQELRPDR